MKSYANFLFFAITCTLATSMTGQVVTPPTTRHPVKEVEKEIKLGEDEPGCKDSPLLPRMAGCSIIQCGAKPEAEGIEIQIGATPDGNIQKEAMDGNSEEIYYLCPVKMPPASVIKFAEGNLVKEGYKIVYLGRDGDDFPIVTALKDTQWVQVSTYMYNDNAAYIQTSIKVAAEDQAASDALADEMNKNGRVVITGLNFEKEELPPDAEKILADVLAFLVRQPDVRIRIEVYSDNTVEKAAAVTLTQRRASNVAAWLLGHGVDRSRISIQGMGDAKPVADNGTPEGQAKNRRVELVKF